MGKCLQTADLYGVVARGGGGGVVVSGGWRGKNANVMVGTFSRMYVHCTVSVVCFSENCWESEGKKGQALWNSIK